MTVIAENDWLGTRPVFYHEKTGACSERPGDVIDWTSLEFDPDGLRDYLDFGYCVFGHTPVQHVRFLPHSTRLVRAADGLLREEPLPDPATQWPAHATEEQSVLAALQAQVTAWSKACPGTIIVPTSGGYDSRLLNALLPSDCRVRTFTYGISDHPAQSSETVLAQRVTEKLGLPWQAVPLGPIHRHLDAWDDLFGISTHAHGMYHLEFYTRIKTLLAAEKPPFALLSGIIGDLWAGSITPIAMHSSADLVALGYSHGLHARAFNCRLEARGRWREEYWLKHRSALQNSKLQLVELARLKMMLLRYLFVVPRQLGFEPWSPFLNPEIALSMLYLPPTRRTNRAWQRDLFHNRDLLFPSLTGSQQNSLDLRQVQNDPPPALDPMLLEALFRPEDIEQLNRQLLNPNPLWRGVAHVATFPKGGAILRRLNLPNRQSSAYAAYCTLRPLERLLARKKTFDQQASSSR